MYGGGAFLVEFNRNARGCGGGRGGGIRRLVVGQRFGHVRYIKIIMLKFNFFQKQIGPIFLRLLKGAQWEQNGAKRAPKVSQRATKMHPKIDLRKR